MKKNVLLIIAICFIGISCKTDKVQLKPFSYEVVYSSGEKSQQKTIIQPGDSFNLVVDFNEYHFPVKRKLRIAGGCVLPFPFEKRGEELFRKFLYTLDDCLDSTDTSGQKYSLFFKGHNDDFDRNAWYQLHENEIISGKEAEIHLLAKTDELSLKKGGNFCLEVRTYLKKSGIHPDDIFDKPDLIKQIPIPSGTYGWQMIKEKMHVPANTACIVLRLGGKGFSGTCRFEAPELVQNGKAAPILPFEKYEATKDSWIGENLSIKEWPEFECSIENKIFFSGKIFDRASDVSDIFIKLPEIKGGKHKITIRLKRQFPAAFPFLIKDIGLCEAGNRDFEVSYVPEFVFANEDFPVAIETNKPNMDIEFSASGSIHPSIQKRHFDSTGLHVVQYFADSFDVNPTLVISDGQRKVKIPVRQILIRGDNNIWLSCTDDIYIYRDKRNFSEYFEWYMREGIGNSYGFRPSYQWSGTRHADSTFYRWATELLQQCRMPYSLMVEGRSIPEKDVNPSEEMMASHYYFGRQAHENDGGFYYWAHFKYIGFYTDLFASQRPKSGIFAKTRVKHTDKGNFVFFDPYACKNMKEGNEYFIKNIHDAKGSSTRHTGPTVMFHNILKAGYDWIGAEQMYGPEDVILSSLRGACKAHGKTDFGTHLATQWGSGPFDTPEHATRLFLSLALSYMHGATHINTEDGLWTTEDNHHRFTREGREHIAQQKKMLDFILTHKRTGNFVAPIAILQGRYDAWRCFVRKGSAWSQAGKEWEYGPAEYSFDLLRVFYPHSIMDAVYKFPCPKEEPGWYTGMPYGPVDLLPIEACDSVLNSYKAIAFLGWNTFDENDFNRLLSFVKNGGTLLLGRPHLNKELNHGLSPKLPQSVVLEKLLGEKYQNYKGIIRRNIEKGKVIYFASNVYPVDSSIQNDYRKELIALGEQARENERKSGWIQGTDLIAFTAYDKANYRKIYLLNTDWWSNQTKRSAKLLLNKNEFEIPIRRGYIETITVSGNIAVKPSSMQTEIFEIKNEVGKHLLKVQTTSSDTLKLFYDNGKQSEQIIKKAGIHEVQI